ncbi:hypothetical protein DNTS_024918 [Danionella cerebrum]|uniref:Interleukin-21 n=1 Tax=Danionella cerebrum TaxID=2873325 RepID=A0A553QIU7_9TELE|nr:hypothetical protein DNTS_024918 [Danionella translucida]
MIIHEDALLSRIADDFSSEMRQTESQCSPESVDMVNRIAAELILVENDCLLYTPALEDYEGKPVSSITSATDCTFFCAHLYQNCSSSTVTCFALEVGVLLFETQIHRVAVMIRQLQRILQKLSKMLQDKLKTCPHCELHGEKKAETFLDVLHNILQRMNAEQCTTKKIKRHFKKRLRS